MRDAHRIRRTRAGTLFLTGYSVERAVDKQCDRQTMIPDYGCSVRQHSGGDFLGPSSATLWKNWPDNQVRLFYTRRTLYRREITI